MSDNIDDQQNQLEETGKVVAGQSNLKQKIDTKVDTVDKEDDQQAQLEETGEAVTGQSNLKQKIDTKVDTVDSQYNIGYIKEFKLIQEDKFFVDPTSPLVKLSNKISCSFKEIGEKFEELKKKRLLIVSCLDKEILYCALNALSERKELYGYEKLLLSFNKENSERDDLQLDMFVSKNKKIGNEKKYLSQ